MPAQARGHATNKLCILRPAFNHYRRQLAGGGCRRPYPSFGNYPLSVIVTEPSG